MTSHRLSVAVLLGVAVIGGAWLVR